MEHQCCVWLSSVASTVLIRVSFRQTGKYVGVRVKVRREDKTGRDESYPSRGQSLAVRVWAHGQGTVESHTSIRSNVSALEEEEEREREFQNTVFF